MDKVSSTTVQGLIDNVMATVPDNGPPKTMLRAKLEHRTRGMTHYEATQWMQAEGIITIQKRGT